MQFADPVFKSCQIAVVGDHIVGDCEPFVARCLVGHDRPHVVLAQPGTCHDPADLQAFRAVDHGNPVATLSLIHI